MDQESKQVLNIKYDNPREVGADRIVNAVAAFMNMGVHSLLLILVRLQLTAISMKSKQYMGGAIAPGIGISTEAFIQEHRSFLELKLLVQMVV